jgi:hypothetical protein
MKKLFGGVVCLAAAAMLVPALSAAGGKVKREDPQTEALYLMKQLAASAEDASATADTLETLNRSAHMLSAQSYLSQLGELKDEINGMAPEISRLAELGKQLPYEDQQTVNRTLTAARKLAAEANQAIAREAGMNPVARASAGYQKLISDVSDSAEALVKSLHAGIARAKAVEKLQGAGATSGMQD